MHHFTFLLLLFRALRMIKVSDEKIRYKQALFRFESRVFDRQVVWMVYLGSNGFEWPCL